MTNSFPKPDFDIQQPDVTTPNRPNSPPRPPTIDVVGTPSSSGGFHSSSENNSPTSPSSSSVNSNTLSPTDKKSLRNFISLIKSMDNSAERLYGFCEHYFVDELTQIAIDQIEKHVIEFRELLVRISSQQQVEEDIKKSKLPSPVTFSISSWKNSIKNNSNTNNNNNNNRNFNNNSNNNNNNSNSGNNDFVDNSSDNFFDFADDDDFSRNWVKNAAAYLKSTPPEITKSPSRKKDTPPLEERLAKADQNRIKMDNIKNREIRMKTNKVRRANELRVQKQEKEIKLFNEKQDGAAQRREAHINKIKKKARDEIEKIQETRFMQELENEGRKLRMVKKNNIVTQRYEKMVKEKREKAKERTIIKSPNSNNNNNNNNSSVNNINSNSYLTNNNKINDNKIIGKNENKNDQNNNNNCSNNNKNEGKIHMKCERNINTDVIHLDHDNNNNCTISRNHENFNNNDNNNEILSSNLNENAKKEKKSSNLTVLESILKGQLPGDFLDIGDEYSNSVPAVVLPEFEENDPVISANMRSISAKMELDNLSPQIAISYLKAVSDQKTVIKWNSNEGQMIRQTLQNMIYLNLPNSYQIIHHVVNMVSVSLPFALHVAFECISSFHQFCFKRNTLGATKELLSLWTKILIQQTKQENLGVIDETKQLMIGHLIRHGVLMNLCYLLEVSTASDMKNEALNSLTQLILMLLESCANFTRKKNIHNMNTEIVDLFGHAAADFIVPGLQNFLKICSKDMKLFPLQTTLTAMHVYQMAVIDFAPFIANIVIEESYANSVFNIFRVFFSEKPQNLQLIHEFILLIGLLCCHFPIIRENLLKPAPKLKNQQQQQVVAPPQTQQKKVNQKQQQQRNKKNSSTNSKNNENNSSLISAVPIDSSLLVILSSLPLDYLIKPAEARVLIPTIVAACFENEENTELVKSNISGSFISNFLRDAKDEEENLFSVHYRVPRERFQTMTDLFCKK